MTVRGFDSFDDLLQALDRAGKKSDEVAGDRGRLFPPGGFFARLAPEAGVVVYGEILDPLAGADPEERDFLRGTYGAPHNRNVRFSRCFSKICPEGEMGDTHVASMNVVLTAREFTKAKKLAWPSDIDGFTAVFGAKLTSHRLAHA
jgi:hypothetical protein